MVVERDHLTRIAQPHELRFLQIIEAFLDLVQVPVALAAVA